MNLFFLRRTSFRKVENVSFRRPKKYVIVFSEKEKSHFCKTFHIITGSNVRTPSYFFFFSPSSPSFTFPRILLFLLSLILPFFFFLPHHSSLLVPFLFFYFFLTLEWWKGSRCERKKARGGDFYLSAVEFYYELGFRKRVFLRNLTIMEILVKEKKFLLRRTNLIYFVCWVLVN